MRPLPRLTAISRRREVAGGDFRGWLEALASSGVDAVQIREKDLADAELFELVRLAVEQTAGRTLVLVNGRADIALAAEADGVHLPADGAPEESVRRLVGPDLLVGRSTHSIAEIDRALAAGADYVYYSPIFETPGKRPVGLGELAHAAGRGLPVIALGGITIDRLEAVAGAGAAGAAAIRMLAEPERLRPAVQAARRWFGR